MPKDQIPKKLVRKCQLGKKVKKLQQQGPNWELFVVGKQFCFGKDN
jgi:hypothetical protein